MAIRLPNWRAEEDSIEEIIKRYPTVSPFVILKTDVNRRGYILSEDAQKLLDPSIHQSKSQGIFHKTSAPVPRGLLLRDGTSICGYDDNHDVRDPYVVEVIDGKLTLTDNGKAYETVEYWRKPDYYDKTTSKGTPMWQILNCRPNRLDLYLNHHCHFWDEPGGGCKYCTIGAASAQSTKNHVPDLLDFDEVQETFEEALKQKGRFTGICASCGTILSGNEIFDDEVELYVNVLGRLREIFKTDHLHVQLVGSPYSQKQLERLKNEAGLIALTSDIEVLNDELFRWICPGKAKHVGYEGWKKRLIDAVEVLGKGGVNSGICDDIREYGDRVSLIEGHYNSSHLDNADYVIAATDIQELNQQIYKDSKERKLLINVVDVPDKCDFIFPSVMQKGKLVVGVSSSGAGPQVAIRLRKEIEKIVPDNIEEILDYLAAERVKAKETIPDPLARKKYLIELADRLLKYEE